MALSQSRLRELLNYNPRTGHFRWRVNLRGPARVGKLAGTINGNGRRQIKIDGSLYYTSRLAFLWMVGKSPKGQAEHKNRVRSDDRWRNLRPANSSQNGANRSGHSKQGLPKGVQRNGKGFSASIKVNYKTICLGTYKTPKPAHVAYVTAARKYFGGFARALETSSRLPRP